MTWAGGMEGVAIWRAQLRFCCEHSISSSAFCLLPRTTTCKLNLIKNAIDEHRSNPSILKFQVFFSFSRLNFWEFLSFPIVAFGFFLGHPSPHSLFKGLAVLVHQLVVRYLSQDSNRIMSRKSVREPANIEPAQFELVRAPIRLYWLHFLLIRA